MTKKIERSNFGMMFDEAIREDQGLNALNLLKPPSNSPKLKKIKQLSKLFYKYYFFLSLKK